MFRPRPRAVGDAEVARATAAPGPPVPPIGTRRPTPIVPSGHAVPYRRGTISLTEVPVIARWWMSVRKRRAGRALRRQLEYQTAKAGIIEPRSISAWMMDRSHRARRRLEELRPLPQDARVLEVGSGAHGLIFHFGGEGCVGVDPLAHAYRSLFPAWQARVPTLAASGEELPFDDATFHVVLCDNVIDHAADPGRIVREISRVLMPGGVLFFSVNTHHPVYAVASGLHSLWQALRLPGEISPFASHTVHLTARAARRTLLAPGDLELVDQASDREGARRAAVKERPRHVGDRLKRVFYKNALWQVLAVKAPHGSSTISGSSA
jgi:SAM-dependent methyltransferase